MSNAVSIKRHNSPQTKPLREDGVETRKRLIAAAGEIFARDGFNASGLREICQVAEANLGAVGYYFGNKEALYRETLINAYRDAATTVAFDGRNLQDWLHCFIHALVRRREKYPYLPALVARELAHPTAVFDELMEVHFKPLQSQLAGIIRRETQDPERKSMADSLAIRVILLCIQSEHFRSVFARFGESEPSTGMEADALVAEIYRTITKGFL
jgi:AcrR family transcriptional regulator